MAIKGIIFDLDGTIYRGNERIQGAINTIEVLEDLDIDIRYFSNNPTKSQTDYAAHLETFGISVSPEAILSAGTVTTQYLTTNHPEDPIFLIGSAGLREQLQTAGLSVIDDPTDATVLVASFDRQFNYSDMVAGYRALQTGATFYGTDPDMIIPTENGMIPGSGAIINAIGGIADTSPKKILGKPSPEAQDAVLSTLSCEAAECLVVGDRLQTDIALGTNAGMQTALVTTGVATASDIDEQAVTPDYVIDSVADVPTLIP